MATICDKINANIAKSCTNPLQAGSEDRMWLINKADIASVVYGSDSYTIENIVLNSGTSAFYIDGKKNSIKGDYAMVTVGDFFTKYDHTVNFVGFDVSPETKADLTAGKDGKYVVIIENIFKGATGNSAFEVFGITTGLEFSAQTRNLTDEATQGAFSLTLTTQTNKEPKMPNPLFVTSYTASKAVVEGLL